MYSSPFSPHTSPHMQQPAPAPGTPSPQMGKPPEQHDPRNAGRMSFGDRFQAGQMNPNFMQQMQQFQNPFQRMQQNPAFQQHMGPGSRYAQMIGSIPGLNQLQNIPYLGSLFGAPQGMGQPQQPQISDPLPPSSI